MKLSLQKYWQLLSRHIQPQKGRFVLLSVLLFGSIGLQIINPQIMRGFIDDALGGGPINQLTVSAAAFIGIAILQQILSVTVTYLGENLNLDMGFHNQHTPGELIERIDGDVAELATFFSQFVVIIVGNVLLLAGILIALFRENWGAGLTFTVFAVVALLILTRIRDIAVVHQKNRRQAEADLFGFIEEQLSGTEDIRSSGAMSYSLRELFRLQGNILRHDKLAHFKGWIIHNSIGGMLVLGNMLAIACGYLLFRGGSITIGTVYLFIHYINLLEQPIWALTHQIEGFQTIGACIERLTELRQVQPKVVEEGLSTDDDTPLGEPLGAGALSLDFQKVTFAYEHDEPVLNDLDFHLAEGKTLGLLGRTGSGKTTLTRLVFRLYDPSAGSISLGRQDIRQVRLNTLRQKIAIVTQDVQLFRASVRENLTFFNPAISDAQIETAIEALELGEWYRSLPQGLDTQLESGGHSLSAGEAQLLAFTRVFLRSPGLVILDEASSRLDPATEQHIERAIDRLLQERTAIIIAHRLETVYRADEIMILENGSTVEHGLRHELASDPESKFFQLLQTGLEEVLV
jgi:ATP-binding cassette subfamily B protein